MASGMSANTAYLSSSNSWGIIERLTFRHGDQPSATLTLQASTNLLASRLSPHNSRGHGQSHSQDGVNSARLRLAASIGLTRPRDYVTNLQCFTFSHCVLPLCFCATSARQAFLSFHEQRAVASDTARDTCHARLCDTSARSHRRTDRQHYGWAT